VCKRRASLAYLAGLCALAAGCKSTSMVSTLFARKPETVVAKSVATPPSSSQVQVVLDQGMEIQWQVQTAQDQPGQVTSGKALIGPDGTVVVGPYGTCKVAGLTLGQATLAFEQQLAPYMKAPSVQLSTAVAAGSYDTSDLAWRPAQTHGQSAVAVQGAPVIQDVIPLESSFQNGVQSAAWQR
jgi:hypothetical protein